ncbi:MAG: hypoxanthine phosphoribosyltransferase [Bacteroidetes bacterium CG2_30_33_31]|nr:MAG: hypoxanthine phosphoribosyltransferase [Bacteroidetes bacterium CG2_30_33_31]
MTTAYSKNTIKVIDKNFEIFIHNSEIESAIKNVADKINIDYSGKKPLFIVILNGAFMFAADLMKNLNIDCEVSFVKLSSYQGTKSTEKVKKIIGLNESIVGRNIIIVEDIIDSGITMENLLQEMNLLKPSDIKIATLLFKPAAFQKDFKIHYIGLDIPNDFIVGYGLDYDGYGRNLPDIYKLVE